MTLLVYRSKAGAHLGRETSLDSRQAAVDREVDAGDVAALVRGEEQSCRRDLFRTSLSAQWDRRRDLLSGFGGDLFVPDCPSNIGVSTVPGLSTLVLIFRSLIRWSTCGPKDLSAALVAL